MLNIKRLKHKDDLTLIKDLAQDIFPHTYREVLSSEQIEYMMDLMYNRNRLSHDFDSGKQIFYLIEFQNQPSGYFSLEPLRSENLLILQKLYLLPLLQGKGLGKTIMKDILEISKVLLPSATRLQLYVNRENKAQYFYLNCGFKVIDSRDNDIGNGFYMNDYIMEYTFENS